MSTPPPIRITEVTLGPEVEELVLRVLRSGQLAQGPMVARFEELCAEMAGARHAVAVANGTVALEAAFEVLRLGPGDEVITTPFTFAATLNAVARTGATVRFADIGDDFLVDPASMRALAGPRTAVLLPVHLYGQVCDMDAIAELAGGHGVRLVEDAAQAHGATYRDRRAGSWGVGCFSFYATKNVACGEGGVVTCGDDGIARALRLLRNQGMVERYRYEIAGRNLRLTDLAAAVAIPQLERIDSVIATRRRNAEALIALLRDGEVTVPVTHPDRGHVWHQFTVLVPEDADRDAVVAAINGRGVGAGVYYPRLVWDYEPFRDDPRIVRDDTPRAAAAAARCVSLPVHTGLREGDLERIALAVREAVDEVRAAARV